MGFFEIKIIFKNVADDDGIHCVGSFGIVEYTDNSLRKECLAFIYKALVGFLTDCFKLHIDAYPYIYDNRWFADKNKDEIDDIINHWDKKELNFWIKYKKSNYKGYVVPNSYKHLDND